MNKLYLDRMLHLLLVILPTVLLPLQVQAHTSLLESRPANGAVMQNSPSVITLTFNEPVRVIRIQLLDGEGAAVSLKATGVINNKFNYVPEQALADGQYLLSFRVLSNDAHPISGSLGFAIGDMAAPEARALTEADPGVLILTRANRTLELVTLLSSVGLVLFPLLFTLPHSLEKLRRKYLHFTSITGLVTSIIGLGLWGALLAEVSLLDFFSAEVWSLANTTTLSQSTAFITLGLTIVLMSTWYESRLVCNTLGVAGSLISIVGLASSGHAAASTGLLTPVFMLHTLMAGIWLGALLILLPLTQRGPDTTIIQVLRQFSVRATIVVTVLLVCAGILSWHQLGSFSALYNTPYGNWLVLKLLLVMAVLYMAIKHRWTYTPALIGNLKGARLTLFRSIRIETMLMMLVIAVTTGLASTPPPEQDEIQTILSQQLQATDGTVLDLSMNPAKAGNNTVEMVFNKAGQPLIPKEVTLRWLNPEAGIEPLSRQADYQSNGNFTVDDVNLLAEGNWQMKVEALIDNFTLTRFATTVTIKKGTE